MVSFLSRRSWVWNQFFVIEEYSGPEPVLIGRLHTDVDHGEGRIKYVLTGEGAGTVFVIDEKTGNIHVTKTLDREEKAQYTLLAQAVDRASNRPLEPPSEFIIKVQDINDNPPVFLQGPYHATVPEMSNGVLIYFPNDIRILY
uniref:Cadherin domain-containing protein n=1 Tax=Laticauda laticaudata TaxID=8630 RepID=A0A8C5RQH0_LATLA